MSKVPSKRARIGISACFLHADAKRPMFTGKTLQYVEQSIVHWVQSAGAAGGGDPFAGRADKARRRDAARLRLVLDGLVLHGGSDVWPGSYGEEPLKPEWSGDRVRDEYEIALLRAFLDAGKPVLGVCRGLQVINVAFGGTLYQDITTQNPAAARIATPRCTTRISMRSNSYRALASPTFIRASSARASTAFIIKA